MTQAKLREQKAKAFSLLETVRRYICGSQEDDPTKEQETMQDSKEEREEEVKGKDVWQWASSFVASHTTNLKQAASKEVARLGEGLSKEERLALVLQSWRRGMKKGFLACEEAEWLLLAGKELALEDTFLARCV